MEALKKKWNSSRGASILLALLFLLVCMMVGASILAAAASNAGKIKSNKEEQQKYLTLSSAVNLLVDELERMEYVGRYTYETITRCEHRVPAVDDEGNPIRNAEGEQITYPEHDCDYLYTWVDVAPQLRTDGAAAAPAGSWTQGDGLRYVLPLQEHLACIFADNFKVSGREYDEQYQMENTRRPTQPSTDSYTLRLTLGSDTNAYGGLSETVQIVVELDELLDGRIYLSAVLLGRNGEETQYAMEALVRTATDEWPELQLVPEEDPSPDADGYCRTEAVRWKLDHISKADIS